MPKLKDSDWIGRRKASLLLLEIIETQCIKATTLEERLNQVDQTWNGMQDYWNLQSVLSPVKW